MLNKVTLIGNVGADPDIRTLPNGGRVANFSLATSERWRDQEGNWHEKTEWHRIAVYKESVVNIIEKYLVKGSKVFVEGSIKSRKYVDSAGIEKYLIEISIRSPFHMIRLLDKKPDNCNQHEQDSEADEDSIF